jgi:K(+)-stimulated pyrophosphate-energized sodium pump
MPRGNDLMNSISDKIKSGARSFLVTEYSYLARFVVIASLVLFLLYFFDPVSDEKLDGLRYAGCFIVGAFLSASAGWNGMVVATDANVKTTQAADKGGLNDALQVAFTGGAVMGRFQQTLWLPLDLEPVPLRSLQEWLEASSPRLPMLVSEVKCMASY